MVDVTTLKAGVKVKLTDGTVGTVRGSYMSTEGIVLRVRCSPESACDRNVPLADVAEVIDAGR